jgi:hypothetical protein
MRGSSHASKSSLKKDTNKKEGNEEGVGVNHPIEKKLGAAARICWAEVLTDQKKLHALDRYKIKLSSLKLIWPIHRVKWTWRVNMLYVPLLDVKLSF